MAHEGVILLGGGALARVLVDMAGPAAFAGVFVEPGHEAAAPAALGGLPLLRDWDTVRRQGSRFLLAVGDIALRRRLLQAAFEAGLAPAAPLVSPHAVVARDAEIGPGSVVGPQSVLAPGVRLHGHVLLMPGVTLGHDVIVHDNCVLTAGAVMGGGSCLERDGFVGLNATIVPRIRLAAGCVVGAAALCLRDVAEASVLVGNPAQARPRGG